MNVIRSWSLLRQVLLVDAICSGLMGIALILAANSLAAVLHLPASLLGQAGLLVVPFAVFVGWLATREQPKGWVVWTVIAVNVLWVADSLLLLASDMVAPNAMGVAFIIAQAVAVGLFAELEFIGLRRASVNAVPGQELPGQELR